MFITAFCILLTGSLYAQSIHDLSKLPNTKTCSISPENFTWERGKGGMGDPVKGKGKGKRNAANAGEQSRDLGLGWKVNPYININAGQYIYDCGDGRAQKQRDHELSTTFAIRNY